MNHVQKYPPSVTYTSDCYRTGICIWHLHNDSIHIYGFIRLNATGMRRGRIILIIYHPSYQCSALESWVLHVVTMKLNDMNSIISHAEIAVNPYSLSFVLITFAVLRPARYRTITSHFPLKVLRSVVSDGDTIPSGVSMWIGKLPLLDSFRASRWTALREEYTP